MLNISLEFREQFRRESKPRRVSIKEMEKAKDSNVKMYMMEEAPFTEGSRIEEVFEDNEGWQENSKEDTKESSNGVEAERGMEEIHLTMEQGSNSQDIEGYVVPDYYETYLHTLAPGQEQQVLIVAKESHSLQVINMFIDQRLEVECIVDLGCQIRAMSEAICHDLGLSYDPTIQLNMQLANGKIDRSLGLARNVPC